ncbi:MAG TPA: aquaporin [Gemmatimonadaceae bacterium]|nr:aquaporin [Gemmatimonadaceae bacterium]
MRDALRHAAAEFIGTFALVFVGSAIIIVSRGGGGVNLVEIAFAHGLIMAAMVTATMRISGHLNPAVTIGFLAARRIAPLMAGVYIAAQLLGAMAASYTLKSVFPAADFVAARGGGLMVASIVTSGNAYLLEAIGTFFLVFVVFGTAVDPHAPRVGGLAIGLTLAAVMLGIGPLTGGSVNPARAFGPAVASGVYEGQAIYWVGPIIGGIAAALLYDLLFLRRGREPVDHGPIDPNPEGRRHQH